MARRATDVVYYIYDSKNNLDCMYNTLMNVTGCSSLDKHSIRAIVPGEVFEPDASNEETREETERTLINILVYLQYISGPNNSRSLPTDINIGDYVKYFDNGFAENIPAFVNVISEAKFAIIYFQLFLTNGKDDTHFVPIVRLDDNWIVMGGEHRSEMRVIRHDELPNVLFTENGRTRLTEHCQKPFGATALFQAHPGGFCIVPLHFGPKQRNDYRGMPQKEVNKIIGWPCLQGTHTRMAKNHGYIFKTMAGIKSLWDV